MEFCKPSPLPVGGHGEIIPHGQKHHRETPRRTSAQTNRRILPVAEAVGRVDILVREVDAAREGAHAVDHADLPEIAVGLPKNMDGSEGPRAELCREFAKQVEAFTGLPVALWDERRTTVEAHNILSQHNYHGKKRKNTVDAVAASLILEGYLNSIK